MITRLAAVRFASRMTFDRRACDTSVASSEAISLMKLHDGFHAPGSCATELTRSLLPAPFTKGRNISSRYLQNSIVIRLRWWTCRGLTRRAVGRSKPYRVPHCDDVVYG